MILIWRGWGLLAIVAVFPLLASCGMIDAEPKWIAMLAIVLSLLCGGAICAYFGTRWNRLANEHTLYFIPLQFWGWVYLTAAGLYALALTVGGVYRGLVPPKPHQADDRADPASFAAVGIFGLLAVVATVWRLAISIRAKPREGLFEDPDSLRD